VFLKPEKRAALTERYGSKVNVEKIVDKSLKMFKPMTDLKGHCVSR
jgi:hypothetical protein